MGREQLKHAVAKVDGALRGQDIGQNDAVAIVMPNGPEIAMLCATGKRIGLLERAGIRA